MGIRLTRVFVSAAVAAFLLAPATAPAASNDRCLVCHINFKNEDLASKHLKQDVTCADCHGISNDHCADEDNLTPPMKMYAHAKVADFCQGCHPKHKETVSAADMKGKVCTDCHGKHRMEVRTRVWDKATGKLLSQK